MVKTWIVIVALAVFLIIMGLLLFWEGPYRKEPYVTSVAIKQVYRNPIFGSVTKVVYDTTGSSEDLSAYRADCTQHSGVFQLCGNICAPTAQACVEVCAVTCTI